VAIIAIGYVFFLIQLYIYLLGLLHFVAWILIKRGKALPGALQMLPFINALNGEVEADFLRCEICDRNYKETDEINYLQCEKKHYFHQKCLVDYLQETKICPYCLKVTSGCCSC